MHVATVPICCLPRIFFFFYVRLYFGHRRDTVETGGNTEVRALVVRPRVALRFQTLYWLSAQCEDKAFDPSAPPVLSPTTASFRGLPRHHLGRRTGRARARETSVAPPVAWPPVGQSCTAAAAPICKSIVRSSSGGLTAAPPETSASGRPASSLLGSGSVRHCTSGVS